MERFKELIKKKKYVVVILCVAVILFSVFIINGQDNTNKKEKANNVVTGIKNPNNEVDNKNNIKSENEEKETVDKHNKSENEKNDTSISNNNKNNLSNESIKSDSKNNSSKPSEKPSDKPDDKPSHTHSWVEQFKTVHHDAVYENKWVVDRPAWVEKVPKYEMREHCYCSGCGADVTSWVNTPKWDEHTYNHAINGDKSGFYTDWVKEQVGTEEIHHKEEGHYERVKVKDGWDEKVSVGYKCSCGAIK
jgi:hypothetical protein